MKSKITIISFQMRFVRSDDSKNRKLVVLEKKKKKEKKKTKITCGVH